MLEANEISCIRGNRKLFRHLSFRVNEGSTLRIRGANGAGKTSLLRLIAGLSPLAEGHITWRGRELKALGDEYSKQFAYVGHTNALKLYLSARENIRLGLRIQGVAASDPQVLGALEEEGLAAAADIPVQWLSAGQQRRVSLIRMMFSQSRKLWILDEPFTSLDNGAVSRLSRRVSEHTANGGVVVYATHQDVAIDAPATVLELG